MLSRFFDNRRAGMVFRAALPLALAAACAVLFFRAGAQAPEQNDNPKETKKIDDHFSADKRWILFDGPGVEAGKAGWSASFSSGGVKKSLSSISVPAIELIPKGNLKTTFGIGPGIDAVAEDKTLGARLEMTLCEFDGVAGFMMQARLTNIGDTPIELDSFTLLQTDLPGGELRLAGDPGGWWATAALDGQIPVVTLNRITRRAGFGAALDLCRGDGTGFSTVPARRGNSKMAVALGPASSGASLPLRIDSEMDKAQVNPGKAKVSEQVLILMTPGYE